MPDPLTVGGPFGRTLQDLFLAQPVAGRAPGLTGLVPGGLVSGGLVPGGVALVEVPDLSGNPVDTAQQKVRERRLVPRVLLVETQGTKDTVKRQEPDAGSFLRPGSPVTLYVIVEPPPGPVDEVVARVREAIRQEGLAKAADVTAAVTGLAKSSEVTAAVQNLASKSDVTAATAALEREDEARKRFEDLKATISGHGGRTTATK